MMHGNKRAGQGQPIFFTTVRPGNRLLWGQVPGHQRLLNKHCCTLAPLHPGPQQLVTRHSAQHECMANRRGQRS